jgi:ESCRT-II complex subunit VPS25
MTTLSPSTTFTYPRHYNFPPFFTRQPQLTTFHAQCRKWSLLIQAYCRFHRLFRLPLDSPLFTNERLNRRLVPEDARAVLDFMRSEGRAEWVRGGEERSVAWVWWRTPEEWAGIIGDWVS